MNILSRNLTQRSREIIGQLTQSQVKRDYLWTLATTGFVVISGVIVYHLAGKYLGPEGFSEYTGRRHDAGGCVPG
jgi:hypothetical protein